MKPGGVDGLEVVGPHPPDSHAGLPKGEGEARNRNSY